MHRNVMDTVADLGSRFGNVLGIESLVDRLPRLAAVVSAEGARSRNGDEDPLGVAGIQNDGVQAHPARARLPVRSRAVATQSGELVPRLRTIGGTEYRRVFHPGINCVGIGERRLEVPHPLELPGMLGAIVKLMGGERLACFRRSVVNELVAYAAGELAWLGQRFASGRLPCFAAIA